MFSVANRRTVIILIQCAPKNYFETAHYNQGQKTLPQDFFIRVKRKIRAFYLFPLIKKPWGRRYSTKKCALNQGEKKLFLEEGAFVIKDKKVISGKFPVNISRRYVMYVMFYHHTDNLWNSVTFASFINFRNCQLQESNPRHCGDNSIDKLITPF